MTKKRKKRKTYNKSKHTLDILEKARQQGWLDGLDFSIFIQNVLISEHGYVIDVGNYENVNAEVAVRLAEQIKKHPILWKLFFIVA